MLIILRITLAFCCLLMLGGTAVLLMKQYLGLAAIFGMLAVALGVIAFAGDGR